MFGSILSSLGGLGINAAMSMLDAAQSYYYQSKLLKKQQDFTERMSNTAHQREVKDLRAAGMNPILTATGGSGASSPVVSAPGVNPSGLQNSFINSASAFSDLKKAFFTEAKKAEADVRQVESNIVNQNKITEATVSKLNAETKNLDAQTYRTKHRVQLPLGGEIPAGAADSLKDWTSWPGRGLELYLDHVGRPFSDWMNNSAKSVKDFFGGSSSLKSSGDKVQKTRNVFKPIKLDSKKQYFRFDGVQREIKKSNPRYINGKWYYN